MYSSPVFRENGNQIELTITSSLDALEYVSAEDFCLSAADELATEVEAENEDDQGKEFTTVQTGVGYVDSVKYGADLTSALTLAAGTDYEVSDTNEYSLPAKISLKFTPTAGYKMWVSYRYWHKDMKIEDIVNALLDLANISNRIIENAQFSTQGVEYVDDLPHKNYNLFCGFDDEGVIIPQFPRNDDKQWYAGNMEWRFNIGRKSYAEQDLRIRFPTSGFLGLMSPNSPFYAGANVESDSWGSITLHGENGLSINIVYTRKSPNIRVTVSLISDEQTQTIYEGQNVGIAGFDFKDTGLEILVVNIYNNGWISTDAVVYKIFVGGKWNDYFNKVTMQVQAGTNYTGQLSSQISWRETGLTETEFTGKTLCEFFTDLFASSDVFAMQPKIRIDSELTPSATSWDAIRYTKSVVNSGNGEFSYSTSQDGAMWTEKIPISSGSRIPSADKHLRIYLIITSYPGYITAENLLISSFISYIPIPLVNLTDLTVGEAIAQLAKMVSYEIGFNQDGVFFFRSRQGRYADAEIDSSSLIDVDNHGADIDNLANRVSVEFGAFKTTVDDFTEGKPRPNTIDTYGVHEKSISSDNFIPADNVDISAAVAKANYEALSTPGYTVQLDCRPDLSLELGDKITVSSENTQIADKNWSDYSKFLKLPIWKRVFKITGIELSFAKRLMSLTLKDVTSDNNVPNMEYNVYQTQFPTPLDYKE